MEHVVASASEKGKPLNLQTHLNMQRACTSYRHGFSLMELLVVLVVVIILAALLFPVLQSSSGRAKDIKCISNLQKIYQGLAGYINEEGHYPGYRVTGQPIYWYQALVPYIDSEPVPKFGLPFPEWARCPRRGTGDDVIGYGYNAFFGHVPPTASDYNASFGIYWQLKVVSVENPSEKIVIGDNKDDGVPGVFSKYQISRSGDPDNVNHPRRHNGGGHFLYADGHVEWLTPAELVRRSKATSAQIFKPF